jgi:uncharacterized NAD-dependent epimerase/dehydratase family protein
MSKKNISYPLPQAVGERKMVVLAEGCFSPLGAKTAVCLVRYIPDEIVAVIDSSRAPARVQDVLGFGGGIPVVASLEDALEHEPDMLVLGTAPKGGMLSSAEIDTIEKAIRSRLHIVSGMHQFLSEDERLSGLAREHGVVLWDVRKPCGPFEVSSGNACSICPVILTVGSDCNTGKMTVAMELHRALGNAGLRAGFAASGQTGIMVAGQGIPIDRVVADFISGATERLVLETAPGMDIVLLEGQGSILHPGYAGVMTGMISGSLPDGMILCHQPTRKVIRNYAVPIPPLPRLVELYEHAIAGIRDIPVIGVALNTFDLEEEQAREAVAAAKRETGLPAADPVRFGADELITAIRERLKS